MLEVISGILLLVLAIQMLVLMVKVIKTIDGVKDIIIKEEANEQKAKQD